MNKNIIKQIDSNLDTMANCRKEKWLLDNDMKKFTRIKRIKFSKEEKSGGYTEEEDNDFEDDYEDEPLVEDDMDSRGDVDDSVDDDEGNKLKKKHKKKRKDFDDDDLDSEDINMVQRPSPIQLWDFHRTTLIKLFKSNVKTTNFPFIHVLKVKYREFDFHTCKRLDSTEWNGRIGF